MSLVTRCPVCATAFRVQRAQLAARGGRVRCGKCGGVFDGVAGLVEEGESRVSLEPSPQLGLFDPSRQTEPAAAGDEPLPAFMEAEPARRPSWGWALLAFVALAALIAQAAYRYRAEVLTYLPEARPLLEMGCEHVGCQVLPRRLLLMSIDGDELRVDPARDGIILLTATIRNAAPFPQQYPSLQLFLEDEAGRPVAGRVLSPRDYLHGRSAAQVAAGIQPRADAPVRVHLASHDLPATRYRLVLFYPS
ncbi:MAG: DUF3426 domain-containing protein [Betaproteobacteria bacterium]